MAYLLIRNSDQAKYGSLMNGLVSQFSRQNNQYPKTTTIATDMLSNHRFDNRGTLNKKRWSQSKKNEDENALTTKTSEAKDETSFAQGNKDNKDKTCYCCGNKGHMSPECPQKSTIKREDWAIRKATVYMQADKEEDNNRDDDSIGDTASAISRGSSKIGSVSYTHLTLPTICSV